MCTWALFSSLFNEALSDAEVKCSTKRYTILTDKFEAKGTEAARIFFNTYLLYRRGFRVAKSGPNSKKSKVNKYKYILQIIIYFDLFIK
jgi:hypothetical protein